jgi:hypothetical protein
MRGEVRRIILDLALDVDLAERLPLGVFENIARFASQEYGRLVVLLHHQVLGSMLDHKFVTTLDYLVGEKCFPIVAVESKRVDDVVEADLGFVTKIR